MFNQNGYAGVAISDIMQATGLKKGGIYNHFDSKDELAIAAFDYAVNLVTKRVWNAVKQKDNAIARLKALVTIHLEYIDNPPIPGGCPIMNTAIEWDDTHSVLGDILRERTKNAMDSWRNLIIMIVKKGIKKAQVRANIEPDTVATILISSIEGGIMISKLYQDSIHLKRVIANLQTYLDNLALV